MIVLYSTNCPQCKALEMKLNKKNIEYTVCTDKEKMTSLGMKAAPSLQLMEDGPLLGFADAIKWVNAQEG